MPNEKNLTEFNAVIDIIWEPEDVITTDFEHNYFCGGPGGGSPVFSPPIPPTGSLLGFLNPFRQCCP